MNFVLDKVLEWAERHLPERRRMWISDLRSESKHIPIGFARHGFLWSGIVAAFAQILRLRVGARRVGQTLLGAALFILCLGGILTAPSIENEVVKMTFYSALPIYGVMGGLAFLSLKLMKRFAILCILALGLFWFISGLSIFTSMDAPVYFFRAFAVEVAMIMSGLFVAASYLGWIEDPGHA